MNVFVCKGLTREPTMSLLPFVIGISDPYIRVLRGLRLPFRRAFLRDDFQHIQMLY